MKHFVYLTDHDPFPEDAGGKIRDARWLELLTQFAKVDALWMMGKAKTNTETSAKTEPSSWNLKNLTTHLYPAYDTSFFKRILSPFRAYPANGYNPHVENLLRTLFKPKSTLILSRLVQGKYIKIAKKIGYQVILDEHNVESDILKSLIHTQSHLDTVHQHWKLAQLEALEKHYCKNADLVFCVSDCDAKILSNWIDSNKIKVFPNLINPDFYENPTRPTRSHIIFAGTLDYYPNEKGLEWFITDIFPHLDPSLHASILVAGRNPSSLLKSKLTASGIELLENPSDLKSLYIQSKILFVPLLHGGGTRLKILEAMASGCLIVTTSKGIEGLPFLNRNGIWIVDDPKDFAHKLFEAWNHFNQSPETSNEIRDLLYSFSDLNHWKKSLEECFI